jgi:hypothetical protein
MPHQTARGIVVCVGFDDLLAITLPRNMRFLSECVVVTSPDDIRTQELVKKIPDCRLHITDSFYANGAKFNKGLGMEEGFDVLGRDGWIQIWDADILFPEHFKLPDLSVGMLYGAQRLVLNDPKQWKPEFNWLSLKPANDAERVSGYFQLFNASDWHILQKPWYDVCFTHAGGCDGYFDSRWPRNRTQRLPFNVLHLGPVDANWFGRTQARVDGQPIGGNPMTSRLLNQQYRAYKGWNTLHPPVKEFQEVVEVPGYQPSGFIPRASIRKTH